MCECKGRQGKKIGGEESRRVEAYVGGEVALLVSDPGCLYIGNLGVALARRNG